MFEKIRSSWSLAKGAPKHALIFALRRAIPSIPVLTRPLANRLQGGDHDPILSKINK